MNTDIDTVIALVQDAISSLERIKPQTSHAKMCFAQARCDLNQATIFLKDSIQPTIPLEPFLGLE